MECELGAGDLGSSLGLAAGSSRRVSNAPRLQCRHQADSGWLEEEVMAFSPLGNSPLPSSCGLRIGPIIMRFFSSA